MVQPFVFFRFCHLRRVRAEAKEKKEEKEEEKGTSLELSGVEEISGHALPQSRGQGIFVHEKKSKKKKKKKDKKKKKKKRKGMMPAEKKPFGFYGVIMENDIYEKIPEFTAWLIEIKGLARDELGHKVILSFRTVWRAEYQGARAVCARRVLFKVSFTIFFMFLKNKSWGSRHQVSENSKKR